jgi:hypothetical protein
LQHPWAPFRSALVAALVSYVNYVKAGMVITTAPRMRQVAALAVAGPVAWCCSPGAESTSRTAPGPQAPPDALIAP